MNPTYTPEPITTVNEGDTIPVKASESLAMEFLNFLYETSVFLSRYVDSVNHFMAEVTDKDFQQLDELMRNLDPNDPITIAMVEVCKGRIALLRDSPSPCLFSNLSTALAHRRKPYELDKAENPRSAPRRT